MIDFIIVFAVIALCLVLLRVRKRKGGCAGCTKSCSSCHSSLYEMYSLDHSPSKKHPLV
ncbi:MAG: FeoB-associated Cys-rich membrane protein [Erysipelotrichaceae bacterium]